jgi:hypothetical protein
VPGAGQLLRDCQARWAGAHHGNRLARQAFGGLRLDVTLVEGLVDRGDLDLLDGHSRLVDAEDAGRLARGGAEAAGELREVVGRVQPFDRFAPVAPPGEIVPLRDEVAKRTSAVAERNPAVHAATGLPLDLTELLLFVDLFPVLDPDRDGSACRQLALSNLQKSLGVSHGRPP